MFFKHNKEEKGKRGGSLSHRPHARTSPPPFWVVRPLRLATTTATVFACRGSPSDGGSMRWPWEWGEFFPLCLARHGVSSSWVSPPLLCSDLVLRWPRIRGSNHPSSLVVGPFSDLTLVSYLCPILPFVTSVFWLDLIPIWPCLVHQAAVLAGFQL